MLSRSHDILLHALEAMRAVAMGEDHEALVSLGFVESIVLLLQVWPTRVSDCLPCCQRTAATLASSRTSHPDSPCTHPKNLRRSRKTWRMRRRDWWQRRLWRCLVGTRCTFLC